LTIMRVISLLALVQAASAFSRASNCAAAPDCTSCVDSTGAFGKTCGWCAINTTRNGGVIGAQCADINDEFDCFVKFQTESCGAGFVCDNATKTCAQGVGGTDDKATCEAHCGSPPPTPSPSPPSPGSKFSCSFSRDTTVDPICAPCTDPTGAGCHYASSSECSTQCAWAYSCDSATLTCKKDKYGSPKEEQCLAECMEVFQCDSTSLKCIKTSPNSSMPGPKYTNSTTCDTLCGKDVPVPYEMRGVWRALRLENTYATGEWLGNITANSITLYEPTAGGDYSLFMNGSAHAVRQGSDYLINVDSTAGTLKGQIVLRAADYSMQPVVDGYLQLALDESSLPLLVASYDSAMTSGPGDVWGMVKCPAGDPRSLVCSYLLDVVIVLDGSNSIISSDWQHALDFANKIVDSFDIGPTKVKVGALQFSDSATKIVDLSGDKSAIQSAISGTRQMKLNTNTGKGLQLAKDLIDSEGRANASKAVILITDGKSNQGVNPTTVASSIKAEGIEVFGIGVGSSISVSELQSLCSTPLSDHYFTTTGFSDLDKVLQALIKSSCHHTGGGGSNVTSPHNCIWHFPANLPVTTKVSQPWPAPSSPKATHTAKPQPAARLPMHPTPKASQASDPADPCNVFPTCDTCIGSRVGGSVCGFCDGDLSYSGGASTAKCAGKVNGSIPTWECNGHYKTTGCGTYGNCGLTGVYRGLRIDEGYDIGEWQATFANGATNTSTTATFKFLNPAGPSSSDTIYGDLQCLGSTCKDDPMTPWKLQLNNGTVINGICGYGNQVQAETTGLMWAQSFLGIHDPPPSWDAAMLNTNATVYNYYKCSEFKKGTCLFTSA